MYTNALFQLTVLENPSRSEVEAIELLTVLLERYEEKHYPIRPKSISPVSYRWPNVKGILDGKPLT